MESNSPQRWADQTETGSPAEAEAAKLVRAIGPATHLSDQALEKAHARLRAALLAPAPSRWIKPTLVGSVLLVAAGLLLLKTDRPPAPAPVLVVVSPPVAPLVKPEPQPQSKPEPEPTPAVIPPVRKQPPPSKPQVAAAVVVPLASRLLEESRLLGVAVQQLRKQRDPSGALATLEDYFARFPDGSLLHDAQAVRVDALLSLDRRTEALQSLELLSKSDFSGLPRAPELRVIRAELLAAAGRLEEAVRAFDVALSSKNAVPELEQRALFGRASCAARLGDKEKSRADLSTYLKLYPEGRFAAAARAALDAYAEP